MMNEAAPTRQLTHDDDRGFGLIEIVVAMFILGLLAVATLPILVQGMRLSATNSTLATATQLANQQIEQVRAQQSCGAIVAATTTVATSGPSLTVTRTVSATCPATGYPITVPVAVSVSRSDTGHVLASASTRVFVSGP
ncbi:MAG TPA: type II secretion system protein [Microbacteriaceae bacterium]|jgi:prepilin-type N-terminal cleavage/methylation domain-containing protein|nr:type II secretion system protein [Microbacteriaceae bacterium]